MAEIAAIQTRLDDIEVEIDLALAAEDTAKLAAARGRQADRQRAAKGLEEELAGVRRRRRGIVPLFAEADERIEAAAATLNAALTPFRAEVERELNDDLRAALVHYANAARAGWALLTAFNVAGARSGLSGAKIYEVGRTPARPAAAFIDGTKSWIVDGDANVAGEDLSTSWTEHPELRDLHELFRPLGAIEKTLTTRVRKIVDDRERAKLNAPLRTQPPPAAAPLEPISDALYREEIAAHRKEQAEKKWPPYRPTVHTYSDYRDRGPAPGTPDAA